MICPSETQPDSSLTARYRRCAERTAVRKYWTVTQASSSATHSIGPAVIKTATSGYDGKGQAKIETAESADAAWKSIGRHEAVVETFVDFASEVSVIVARNAAGEMKVLSVK